MSHLTTTLFLCEKPSQARALAAVVGASTKHDGYFSGGDVVVTYCYGHMLEYAMPDAYVGSEAWSLDALPILPDEWKFVVCPNSLQQFETIGGLLKLSGHVVIATDPDDEGEVIGREVLDAHQYKGLTSRLWVSALNVDALRQSLDNLLPLTATEPYYQAGLIRGKLDWLYGMNLSRAISIVSGQTAQVGRVKTKLLHALVEREKLIDGFTLQPSDSAEVVVEGVSFRFNDPTLSALDWNVLVAGKYSGGKCVSVAFEEQEIPPPLPYTLSALLVDAFNMYGIPLVKGSAAVQSLYELGAISYPRTSSTQLPGQTSGFAAHHAIVELQSTCPPWLDESAQQIFSLIRRRADMHLFGAAKLVKVDAVIDFGGRLFSGFFFKESNEGDAGWINTSSGKYGYPIKNMLKDLKSGDVLSREVRVTRGATQPPKRFTEGTLLEFMASNNIGTESTRVAVIASMLSNEMLTCAADGLQPTTLAARMHEKLPEAVLNDRMNTDMELAVEDARALSDMSDQHMVKAVSWLASIINDLGDNAGKASVTRIGSR